MIKSLWEKAVNGAADEPPFCFLKHGEHSRLQTSILNKSKSAFLLNITYDFSADIGKTHIVLYALLLRNMGTERGWEFAKSF